MTKAEADRIVEALRLIETGRVYLGVDKLRHLMIEVGRPPDPVVVEAREARERPPGKRP